MRELVVNRITLPKMRKRFDIIEVCKADNGVSSTFTFKCKAPHGLEDNSKITLVRKSSNTKNTFICKKINDCDFSISIPKYWLVTVHNYAEKGTNASLEVIDKDVYTCVSNIIDITIYSNGKELKCSLGGRTSEDEEYLYEEDLVSRCLVCNEPLDNIKGDGKINILNTWHLKDGEFDKDNVTVLEDEYFFSSMLPLDNILSFSVNDNSALLETQLNTLTNELLPEIIDNEKQQFIPMIVQKDSFKKAKEIVFNLHFRERELEPTGEISQTFKTNESLIWNGYTWKDDTESDIVREYTGFDDDYADELNHLGFTEDDIKYQKTKLKKSFIRLLFYSSKDFFEKELLGYSTIFLDSGRLYKIYSQIKSRKDGGLNTMKAFDEQRVDRNLRLDAKFVVRNKFQNTSSEGFYLYLFPDEIKDINSVATIYMKVEFNHAGFGKTIPMMMPRKDDKVISSAPLLSTDTDFPVNFFKKLKDNEGNEMLEVDIEKYLDSTFIPVNIKYDNKSGSYIYWFPWFNRGTEDKITINLWEPKIKGKI